VDAVTIVVYVIAGVFLLLMGGLFFSYRRTGHYGFFLMGITYGAAGGLAIALAHWWPLAAGFVLAWVLKLLGLDPGWQTQVPREPPPADTGKGDEAAPGGKGS
jgi:hypothetical protein